MNMFGLDIAKSDVNMEEEVQTSDGDIEILPTKTEYAEVLDVTEPVLNFYTKIKDLAYKHPFELDNFQKQAILKLEEGHNVLVAAHTSAGKTAVAEYAIAMARRDRKRVIYTSPLKALSNQKYNDLSKMFGSVGLLTGDAHINTGAPCLVMTTEILRHKLYSGLTFTQYLKFVIFDEVHYINNAERGCVWEEILILLPAHVSIVLLSATIPNTLQFADWIGRTRKRKVYVVSTLQRPIPLCHYLYTGTNSKTKHQKFLIVDESGNFLQSGYNKAVEAKKSRKKDNLNKNFDTKGNKQKIDAVQSKSMWYALINHLKSKMKLPAVCFIFSILRCVQNAEYFTNFVLTTETEKEYISSFIETKLCQLQLKAADKNLPQILKLQSLLMNGIGIHHSGIIPVLREIVEMLFQTGHVKVLFTTETFSIGINVPARSVVFEEITKYDGVRSRTLLPHEYIQMSGRAGRRGLDETGTVIIMCQDEVPSKIDLKDMMLGTPQVLSSQFRLTYAMILKLLRSPPTVTVEDMMQRSFSELDQLVKADSYKKQLELAEKEYEEYSELPSYLKRLEKFYDLSYEYLEVMSKIMPAFLNDDSILNILRPGVIMLVSIGPYINQLALYLNTDGPYETPYTILLLNTPKLHEESFKFELDETWYRLLSYSNMYNGIRCEEISSDFIIICISPKDVIEITKNKIKINEKPIIEDWKRRQMPEFKNSPVHPACMAAVRKLTDLSHDVRTKKQKILYYNKKILLPTYNENLRQSYEKMIALKNLLNKQRKYTHISDFICEFAKVHERKVAKKKVEKYIELLSFENLKFYQDYKNRLLVLRELGHIDENANVTSKGHGTSRISNKHELLIGELINYNIFENKTPAEIAALMSAFIFPIKRPALDIPSCLAGDVCTINYIFERLSSIERRFSVCSSKDQPNFGLVRVVYEWAEGKPFAQIITYTNVQEGIVTRNIQQLYLVCSSKDQPNFGLVRVVYEWAEGKPFAQIITYTNVQEGIVTRNIQQLYLLLIELKDAALAMNEIGLRKKLITASEAIKRDLVFADSLYTINKKN